jgi:hypothetical protein
MEKIVIMVHGLGRSRFSMFMPGRYLQKRGFSVLYYSYNSTRYLLDAHFAKFADYLNSVAAEHPDAEVHFVSHSMGGILIRGTLTPGLIAKFAHPGRIVMLAPPNCGSKMAANLSKYKILRKILKPLEELSDSPGSVVMTLPVPENMDIGIISGRFDGKVRPEEAVLDGAKEHLTVNSYHTFIMNRKDVKKEILHFLNNGEFSEKSSLFA